MIFRKFIYLAYLAKFELFKLYNLVKNNSWKEIKNFRNDESEWLRKSERKRFSLLFRAHKKRVRIASSSQLEKYKTSDTLFVFGGGPSINQLDSDCWQHISKHDSFALNWFFAHPFIPTFHHMELPPSYVDTFKKLYDLKYRDVTNSPFILNFNNIGRYDLDLSFVKNLYCSIPSHFKGINENELLNVLKLIKKSKLIEHDRYIHVRGSLSIALSFAYGLKYRKIILCGFDMNSMEYFFDDKALYPGFEGMISRELKRESNKIIKDRGECTQNNFHRTTDSKLFIEPPLDKIVYMFNDIFLKEEKIDLYIQSPSTILYPKLPIYPLF